MAIVTNSGGYVNVRNVNSSATVLSHIRINDLVAGTHYIKIIDKSDRLNYKHGIGENLRLTWFELQTDVSGTSEYTVCVGYLKNVTNLKGDFTCFKTWNETRKIGNSIIEAVSFAQGGININDNSVVSKDITLNVTELSSVTSCRSVLYPEGGDSSGFGNDDLVIRFTINSGIVSISFECLYYSE
jgi:hypothetical protein